MPQEQPLISVIVPVYKVEEYLDQCVESIVNQTYRNLEIILVDDGSPDKCPEMCDAWAKKDSRIKVVHKENGGVSSARNVGLDYFTGDYVTFVDSDDIIYAAMIASLVQSCEKHGTRLAMCSVSHFSSEDEIPSHLNGTTKIFDGKYICRHFFECNASMAVIKLYHASLVRNRRLIVGRRVGEDAAFNYPIFFDQEKVAFINSPMYFYREHPGSVMGSYKPAQLDELDTFCEMLDFYKERKAFAIYNSMALEYYARILAHEHKMKKCNVGEDGCFDKLRENKKKLMTLECISVKTKLAICFGELFPSLFRKIFFGRQNSRKKKYGGR